MDLERRQSSGDHAGPASHAKTGIRAAGHQPTDGPACGYAIADQAPGTDRYSYSVFLETL